MSPTEAGYLEIDGGRLYYESAGDGTPVVLSHAGFLDSRMFDEIWEPLAAGYRVIRYDMRGFGKSDPVAGPVCRRDDLARLLDHLGITQAHLVGCSIGGELCLDLALEHPGLAKSITLVNSTPGGFDMQGEPPRYLFEMFDAVQNGDVVRASELQICIWLDGMYREPDQVNEGLRKKALEMNRLPVERKTFFIADMQPANPLTPPAVTRLQEVKCPALIMAGSLDHPEVLRAASEMAEHIPAAKQVIMDGCAHVPLFEQPDVFLSHLQNFLP
ncbi:MAG: alpha/beta hydrolase [Leptolinea sp.]|nr:alpha/beta hydrolase [Leptolinea sp.]